MPALVERVADRDAAQTLSRKPIPGPAERTCNGNVDFQGTLEAGLKHGLQRPTTEVHDYGPGRMTSEPVLIRKSEANTGPFGFHGGWAPDVSAASVAA